MESFATGLKRIQKACDKIGCKVEYFGDEYGFTVRFYRHCGDFWAKEMSAKNGTLGTQNGTQEAPSYKAQIIAMVQKDNKISRKKMAEKLSVSLRTIQRIINSIDDLNYIGSGRGGYWEYRK